MPLDFCPPKENRLLLSLSHTLLPVVMRGLRRIVSVHIPEGDWPNLEGLRRGRAILSANHPTTSDPLIAMFLSRRLGEGFNYMACRELFHGPWGWTIQRLGAYSVHRGLPDRQAIRMTRRLLAELDRKVVIFPEGETYEHNDLIIPFQQGIIQIGFSALDDLEKQGRPPELPVLPLALKYCCVRDPRSTIDAGLRSLEDALGLSPRTGDSFYPRLRHVGERVFCRMEAEFHLKPDEGAPLADRIQAAKEHVLDRVAREVGVIRPAAASLAEQMRFLFNTVNEFAGEFADARDSYGQRQQERRLVAARPLLLDLRRVHNFLAVTDGYVAERMTGERFLDVIGRLQREVLGRVRHSVPREAVVRIAPPEQLGAHYEGYRQNKKAAVGGATARVEAKVRTLLDELSGLGRAMED
jgi:1-acyl-sn-glycerol-3-phosphate acyltransferase